MCWKYSQSERAEYSSCVRISESRRRSKVREFIIHETWISVEYRLPFFHIVLKVNFMPSKLIRRATKLRANYAISNCPLLHTVESDLYLSLTLKVKDIFLNSDCKSLMYSQKSLRSRYRFTELRIYGKTEDLWN